MATILLDINNFRAIFPAFDNTVAFPSPFVQMQWDMATNYVNDKFYGNSCYKMTLPQQTSALNLMTAHLLALSALMADGDSPGVVTGATIDKITVAIQPPPSNNSWQYWLNQTPYGQQLLALLTVASTGGYYYGGFPIVPAFRR